MVDKATRDAMADDVYGIARNCFVRGESPEEIKEALMEATNRAMARIQNEEKDLQIEKMLADFLGFQLRQRWGSEANAGFTEQDLLAFGREVRLIVEYMRKPEKILDL